MQYAQSLFIFRRDLRLADNTGLIYALKNSQKVIPCFIFDPRQVKSNMFKSEHALAFMYDALADLNAQIAEHGAHLYFFEGKAEQVVKRLLKTENINAVIFNKDYTPFSTERDAAIADVCHKHQISCVSFDDALLHAPGTVLTTSGQPYRMFTPFFKRARQLPVPTPHANNFSNYATHRITGTAVFTHRLQKKGGRTQGLSLLSRIKTLTSYAQAKDFPAQDATSHLSPHLKFTTLSIREVYHTAVQHLGKNHPLVRQLYWRDFFTHILFHFAYALTGPFHKEYASIGWSKSQSHFERWCTGTTGFPLVDAGMRELHATGIMHNRVRLVTASFLVKDLHINWQWGERYFATMLTDYDPAVNNGNWQWVASTGCDAQPYFRIFNPWLQQKKFDRDAAYIKQWVPELQNIPARDIHRWYLSKVRAQYATKYPEPMVEHAAQALKAKKMYQQ